MTTPGHSEIFPQKRKFKFWENYPQGVYVLEARQQRLGPIVKA